MWKRSFHKKNKSEYLTNAKVFTFGTKCSKYTNYPINKNNYEKNLLESFEYVGHGWRFSANGSDFQCKHVACWYD